LAEAKPAPCQVGNKTGNPCPRRAEVEILGVAFCGPCAREQEAYFAIGELTDEEEAWDFRSDARRTEDLTVVLHHGHSGVVMSESLSRLGATDLHQLFPPFPRRESRRKQSMAVNVWHDA
jgi:hypothetical protein